MDGVTGFGTSTFGGQAVTNRIVLSGKEANGTDYTLTYNYNPTNQTLVRTKEGGSYPGTTTLLTGCTYLNFGLYQRVPKMNSFDQFDAADLPTCKVVQLDWICSRKIFNKTANTETIESAKVVIRKK